MRILLVLGVVFLAGISAKRAGIYTGRQRLVGYWGQNGYGSTDANKQNWEKSLGETCKTTKFDILVVAFVIRLWHSGNKDNLPYLNLAYHCNGYREKYRFLPPCPTTENGIKECQKLGKKVIMSIGGDTMDGALPSADKARELAKTFYDLFLGGSKFDGTMNLRPFGSAVMDGIDLDIETVSSGHEYYADFITEMRRLMDDDKKHEYLITAAPQCPYPDHNLGTALSKAGELVDHLYVQFYNNNPCQASSNGFVSSLQQWLDFSKSRTPLHPLIFIGIPAATRAASAVSYLPPQNLAAVFKNVRDKPLVSGIMLWDASWDQSNVISGKRYSEYAFALLNDGEGLPVPTATTDHAKQPPTAASPSPTGNCRDEHPACPSWISVCQTHPDVRRLCNKTCNVC